MENNRQSSAPRTRSATVPGAKVTNTTKHKQQKQSWRGTSDPSRVDKYVDCDEENGWC
ncbi:MULTISPECIES: DUF2553 family protein [Pontibacillus]|uniref:DUF2553 family protein n=1 Tax=Pontibacillus chungwhensis TaxID=265426 RepID=A0ABY8UWR9_9BACI|nr:MULTISPECIES: DUF2553 family protein [Pontibacillus]MCD5325189.1 YusG family protein [Pontibacillus sp. HN14]WIF97437.1 DUF2553 family protein [Pontibacillus chungwhensis]